MSQVAGKDATRARASSAAAEKKPGGFAGRSFLPNFISTALAPVLGGMNHNPHGHALLPASSSEMAGYLYKQVRGHTRANVPENPDGRVCRGAA